MANPSKTEIIEFAKWFCNERIETFQKDMRICMTPNENKQHAYMPAIMGCASFIELFSGLFSGNVSDPVGIELLAVETGENTGIFFADMQFSTKT